jgi:predicted pyridoxine 5'-phosphate oxidase superfamily flavin-nucleotide-binding protein
MPYGFLDIVGTPSVQAAQVAQGSRKLWENFSQDRTFDRFGDNEVAFIEARDSFYLASVGENGWPYVQHRGGPPGFLKVLDEKTLGFADFRGNRQYISLGNVAADDRVALFLMDYPNRARLKILAHMTVKGLADEPELAAHLTPRGYRAVPERLFVLSLAAFDWNCSQHITPRYTSAQVEVAVEPLREQIAALDAENRALKARLGLSPPES